MTRQGNPIQQRRVIGLTGNIASGKSTVAQLLKGLGAMVVDADQLARQVVEPGSPGLLELVQVFGKDILNEDGSLNRSRLGNRVFGHQKNLMELNNITHSRISHLFREKLATFRKGEGPPVMVVEAALLFEAGWDKLVDQVWFVTAPLDTRIERLMKRSGLSKEDAMQRIWSQAGEEEKMAQSNEIILNDKDMEALSRRVSEAYQNSVKK